MQEQEYSYMRPVLSTEGIKSRRSSPAEIIPVVEALDLNMSPLDVYMGLKKLGSRSFLFESADLGGKSARFSFVGTTDSTIAIKDGIIYLNGSKASYPGGPMALLKDTLAGFKPLAPVFIGAPASMPVFYGGLAGYLSYDLIRYFDHIGESACDDIGCMDAELVFANELVVFDHANKKMLFISNAMGQKGIDDAKRSIERVKVAIKGTKPAVQRRAEPVALNVTYGTSKERYMEMVERAKEYILDGDAFQIVLSQRMEIDADIDPISLYQTLKEINPSPYMYLLEFGDTGVVGSSPEILVKVEDRKIIVRPIAGTRPRGKTEQEDSELEAEMLADPKERAEHVMLVDLGRNDVGKVAKFGSVRVDDFMSVEKYSHVQHIVSNVVGDLRDDMDPIDVLTATFPAGTVSGAPKTRAMQIIEELEGRKRGLYAGCVGYFCFNSNADLAIAIRTILVKNKKAYVQAGAGIVMDSVPENEYVESINKGAAMLKALGRSVKGGK